MRRLGSLRSITINHGLKGISRGMIGYQSLNNIKYVAATNNRVFMRNYAADRMGHSIDGKIDDISDMEYNRISNDYLEDLGDELDLISEDHSDMDFDLSQGVLTLNTKNGTYVINRQPPNKQIWLSSPISGPNRYDLINGKWASLRDNGRLTDLLSHELSQTYNDSIELQLEN